LHQCPEIGFDLPRTLAIVKRELDEMGVSYTEKFGTSSVVAVINDDKAFTIALRGDMDGLPITEAGSNPYPSQIPGQMHACGHDAHTAQMLAVTRKLNDMKDAIRMAVEAYMGMELMRAREIEAKDVCILNIGAFNGGVTNNIVCDYAKLFLTVRTHDDGLTAFFKRRIEEICHGAATMCGGTAKVTQAKFLPYVPNHPEVTALLRRAASKVVGEAKIEEAPRRMGAEDFSFLARQKPGVLFRLGAANDTNPDTRCSLHNDHFDIDERCFEVGIPIFVNFVLDNQDGVNFREGITV
jgi:metal-dependent amidase/aminoacylase/carboxypeptidase family protein